MHQTDEPGFEGSLRSADGASLAAADREHLIHPFLPLPVAGTDGTDGTLIVERAEGLRLWTVDGREFLDSKASLFNVNVGWGREELGRVAGRYTTRLGYATLFFDQGHGPAALLGAKLAAITPGAIDRFLLTVGGSDAAETALKVARLYHSARGHADKDVILARESSYHGMSMGATSLTGSGAFWEGVGPMLPGVAHCPQPDPRDPDSARVVEEAIERIGPGRVAAFIAEPISNPAGVNVPHPSYWPAVREICDRHDVLLIADEVITGFGRTGRMFCCEHWGLEPDAITISKGLTSGYQPLGAAGFTSRVIDAIAAGGAPFLHGFTAGGHPAACAVALANIEIIEREGLVGNAEAMGERLRGRLRSLSADLGLGEVRGLGLLCAIDLLPADADAVPGALGERVEALARRRGMLIRRYADTVIIAPALIAGAADVEEIVDRLGAAVGEANAPRSRA